MPGRKERGEKKEAHLHGRPAGGARGTSRASMTTRGTAPPEKGSKLHEREVFEGNDGSTAQVSWCRLRKEWAVSVRDAHGIYETIGVYPSREEALAALRDYGWQVAPGA